ncbi:hypothetical protein [Sphingomonas sp. ID0503]|uniref:hypothetical protein n=1 Tax=Sphingomonas sp. ID0503 TaxID=3399691 RepID=UPI003AFA9A21
MTTFAAAMLGLAMIAAFVLIGAGGRMIYRGGDRKRGLLMIVMALVLLMNVLILALPV